MNRLNLFRKSSKFRSFVLSVLGAFILLSYSNCGGMSTYSGGFSSISGEKSENEGLSDSAGLALNVNDLIFFKQGDIGFNVGGDCELGEFSNNEIAWKLDSVNGRSIIPQKIIPNACKNKRFVLTVLFPSGFNYNDQYTVKIELRAKDEQNSVAGSTESFVRANILN